MSALFKTENNSKNQPKQNTNNKNTIPKPKNKSNSPNPPHTPKNNSPNPKITHFFEKKFLKIFFKNSKKSPISKPNSINNFTQHQ